MSLIKNYSQHDFELEFPVDLGEGVRAQHVDTNKGYEGVLIAHLSNNVLCATLVSLKTVLGTTPVGSFSKDPLGFESIHSCWNCPNQLQGSIHEGHWSSVIH